MLYDRWRAVAAERRRDRALVEIATDRAWTFGELLSLGHGSPKPDDAMVFPRGAGAGFILEVLRGWRHAVPVCPLEPEQARPALPSIPAGCAHLKTTSATTDRARLVAFTASQLAADPDNLVTTMGLRPDWPNVAAISLAHSYGFSSLVLPLLLHGIPLILAPSGLPEALRRAATSEPSLTLPAVPALWRGWLEARCIPGTVRLAISAGAPLPLPLERAAHDSLGLKIHNFYGATECGGIAYDASDTPRADPAFAGNPIHRVDLRIGVAGGLEIRGPAVGSSYWPDPDDSLRHGVYRTADLAELPGPGIRLLGRSGDLINVAGRKVTPDEIERRVLAHPAVTQCLVFGVPRKEAEHGDSIVAVVEAAREVSRETLEHFLAVTLPAWQLPRDWWFVDQLTATARGKPARREWRDAYLRARRAPA